MQHGTNHAVCNEILINEGIKRAFNFNGMNKMSNNTIKKSYWWMTPRYPDEW